MGTANRKAEGKVDNQSEACLQINIHLGEDDSQWEADSAAEAPVAHDDLLLELDPVDAAQVDEGGEEEGAEEAVDEAEHNGGHNEPRVEVVSLLCVCVCIQSVGLANLEFKNNMKN